MMSARSRSATPERSPEPAKGEEEEEVYDESASLHAGLAELNAAEMTRLRKEVEKARRAIKAAQKEDENEEGT